MTITEIVQSGYENGYIFHMPEKRKYSDPKIYCGGIDIAKWSKLTELEKQNALDKRWYVYFSFENPSTGKLTRQPLLRVSSKKFTTKSERIRVLKAYQSVLHDMLAKGLNPYDESRFSQEEINISLSDAIDKYIVHKEVSLKPRSLSDSKNKLSAFLRFIQNSNNEDIPVLSINKKMIMNYLNGILLRTSARNRNNARVDLNTFFQWLFDNEYVNKNIVASISKLKTKEVRHKIYSEIENKEIFEYVYKKDPTLLIFIKFISYNFLRPIEICRIKIGDINKETKQITFEAKNKTSKIKIIPSILWKEIPTEWLDYPKEYNLFGTEDKPMLWESEENNKRDFYSKRFKKIKEALNLDKNHTMYSFRHTFITKLYRKLRESKTPFQTKSELMLITGHSSMTALEKYLREIDAEIPNDYSDLIK